MDTVSRKSIEITWVVYKHKWWKENDWDNANGEHNISESKKKSKYNPFRNDYDDGSNENGTGVTHIKYVLIELKAICFFVFVSSYFLLHLFFVCSLLLFIVCVCWMCCLFFSFLVMEEKHVNGLEMGLEWASPAMER